MRLAACLSSAALALALTACSERVPPPATPMQAPQEAVSRIGDVTVRATVVPTTSLGESVARQYGLTQEPDTVMLLVGVRQGPEAQEVALPAAITAVATDLAGRRHAIALRELRSGDLLDYVGTLEVKPPDTLRFDVTVVREGGAQSQMQFTREFHP